jgi:PAS domain S-box-containing protein
MVRMALDVTEQSTPAERTRAVCPAGSRISAGPGDGEGGGLAALAAGSARIAATQTLAEWRTVLTEEIGGQVPGCTCTIHRAADVLPTTEQPAYLMVPLGCDGECLARLVVRDPAGRLVGEARAAIGVLASVAALRLAHLPDRITRALQDSERELTVLRRLQELGQALRPRPDGPSLPHEVVRLAAELTGAETATLMLDEPGGRGLILAAEWGHPDGPRPRCYLGRWGVADQVIRSGQVVLIDHAPTDARYAPPAFGAPCQSLLGVPLHGTDRVIGSLNVTNHTTPFAFHQTHIDLLATLAGYAARSIEVAARLEEHQEQIRQLRYLHQHAPDLIRVPVLPALFHDAAGMAAALFGTDQAAIYTSGDTPDSFTLVASAGLDAGTRAALRVIPGWVYAHWQGSATPVDRVIGPLRADPYVVPEWHARCQALGVPALLVLPLVDERTGLLGFILGLGQHRSDFTPGILAAGRLFANQITAALRNAQLYAEVRETRDYLQALVAGSGEAIITLDLTGTVLSWNPAATTLLSYEPGQAIGNALAGLVNPPGLSHLADGLAQTLRGETVREFETRLRRADGRLAEVLLALSPIRGHDNQVLGVSIIGRDIGARLAAEREMQRHNDDLQVMNLVTTAVNQVLQADEMLQRSVLTLCNSSVLDAVCALVPDLEGGLTLTVCERRGATPRQERFAPGPEASALLEQARHLRPDPTARFSQADAVPLAVLLERLHIAADGFAHSMVLPVEVAPPHPAWLLLGRRGAWSGGANEQLLFETVAWQIGLGLNKARLYEHVSRAAHEQHSLYDISRRIQSAPDIEATLPDVLEVLLDLGHAAGGEVYLAQNLGTALPPRPPTRVAVAGAIPAAEARRLELPMRHGEQTLGSIVLSRPASHAPFRAEDHALAGAVADQLALALENRRLLVRDLAVLDAVPRVKSAPLHLEQLVARLLAQAQTIAATSAGVAFLYDSDTDDWQVAAESGIMPAYWPLPLAQRRALLDELRRQRDSLRFTPPEAAAGALLLLVPMLADDRLVGAFALPGAPEHGLPAREPFLSALAGRAAVIIANQQLQVRAEELLILEERTRIAREMHDGLAQTLTQIRNRCEYINRILHMDPARATAELEQVRADLKQSVAEVVRMINALRPLTLDELGLAGALRKLAEEFTLGGRLRIDVDLPAEDPRLPPQIELTVFRVVQEALNSVVRHSGADSCWLTLQVSTGNIIVSVQDNGTGFGLAPGIPLLDGPHRGLTHIRERIRDLGGVLTIISTPGGGTQLVATLPRLSFRALSGGND